MYFRICISFSCLQGVEGIASSFALLLYSCRFTGWWILCTTHPTPDQRDKRPARAAYPCTDRYVLWNMHRAHQSISSVNKAYHRSCLQAPYARIVPSMPLILQSNKTSTEKLPGAAQLKNRTNRERALKTKGPDSALEPGNTALFCHVS